MPKPELTKKLIADTLKKLASDKHLDKISVGEIADAAGLNRQTFYYHFQDKQELICWIFDTDISNLTDKKQNNTLLDDIVEYIYAEKSFYIDALTSEAQNNLRDHIYCVCVSHYMDQIISVLGNREMDEKAITLFARFITNAVVGTLVQWAQEGMEFDNIQFIEDYAPLIEEQLKLTVNKYAVSVGQ